MSAGEMVPLSEISRGVMIHGGAGTLAMATMPDEEFAQRLAALKKGQDRIRAIKRELMTEGVHYGTIPGTDKPALMKPGAEVLCSIYGLRPDFIPTVSYGDGVTEPAVRVSMRCELHLGDLSGPVVAVGYGAANSWERKHRYRRGERTCPDCGVVGSVKRSGFENKNGQFQGQKGWWCRECRTNWDNPKEPAILEQQTGMETNPDQHDLENTVLKMAKKRAHVDSSLTGTASSDLFTQDVDEEHQETVAPPAGTSRPAAPAQDRGYPSDPTAHERHGVEPAATSRAAGAPSNGPKAAPCPQCGDMAPASKYPKPGKTHYCGVDKLSFEPGVKP